MAVPKSIVKIKKGHVTYTDSVDRVQYTIHELIRGALRDVGKVIVNKTRARLGRRTGRLSRNTQMWVRSKQKTPNLWVGFKMGGFYGIFQELGAPEIGIPKQGALRNTTYQNIDLIQDIVGKYLSAVEDERRALSLISEEEYVDEQNS